MYYRQSVINQFCVDPQFFFFPYVYRFCKLSKEGEKWKTRLDSIYFFNRRPYQRMRLQTVRRWIDVEKSFLCASERGEIKPDPVPIKPQQKGW